MKVLLWLSVIGILYPFVLYPSVMWALARWKPKHCKLASISPSVRIVLAVHNGFDLLPRQIARLQSLDYADLKEIIIVPDGSTDGSAPAGALFMLNAAAVVGLYKFLSSGRDLWKVWTSGEKSSVHRTATMGMDGQAVTPDHPGM